MIARLDRLRQHPTVFRSLTGVPIGVFDDLVADVLTLLKRSRLLGCLPQGSG